jgi:hypothetical protein
MRQLLLLAPLVLILIVSGCTIPGGFNLPFFGATGPSGENDVIRIISLTPFPQSVTHGQDVNLVAYVQNLGTEETGVEVILYDHCSGLFTKVQANPELCDSITGTGNTGCMIDKILPQETRKVSWELEPADVNLVTQCNLKVLARYDQETTSVTTLEFIHPTEYTVQIEQGTFTETAPYIAKGPGPVKAYFTVEDNQPIPTEKANLALHVDNVGGGFIQGTKLSAENLKFDNWGGWIRPPTAETCRVVEMVSKKENITFVNRQAPPIPCQVQRPPDEQFIERTTQLQVTAKYTYEFRMEGRVVVNPKK